MFFLLMLDLGGRQFAASCFLGSIFLHEASGRQARDEQCQNPTMIKRHIIPFSIC